MDGKETQLQQMLTQLRTKLLMMGAAVGIALDEACTALAEGNAGRARAVVAGDGEINQMENEIDELALALLVRNQPVAHDLRFVVGSLRLVIDLERIGDEAAAIAERTMSLHGTLPGPVMTELTSLMRAAVELYKRALEAFRAEDKDAALDLCRVDGEIARQEVDSLNMIFDYFCGAPSVGQVAAMPGRTLTEDVTPSAGSQPVRNYSGMSGVLICRSLNRICRRASNIAEHTYFIAEGVNIKHQAPCR